MPPPTQAGAASPPPADAAPRDHFAEFVNKNSYIPVWLHPDVAHGVLRHFGKNGQAIVHPHPTNNNLASGGIVTTPFPIGAHTHSGPRGEAAASPTGPPAAVARPMGNPPRLAGIQGAADAKRSIFGGGTLGASGPTDRTPVFAQQGAILDGRSGVGKVPGVDLGRDTVHAMLEPKEAVFNQKQLAGIKPRKGKEHLLRADQKKAMRNARRK